MKLKGAGKVDVTSLRCFKNIFENKTWKNMSNYEQFKLIIFAIMGHFAMFYAHLQGT
jgi:hypothetical protein